MSAFPAIAGPVLLIDAHEQGTAFAARAATGTVLGLVALSAFAAVYGRTAAGPWPRALAAGWAAAAVAAGLATASEAGLVVAVVAAGTSLWLAHEALPAGASLPQAPPAPRWDLPLRIAVTVVLVAALAVLAGVVGAVAGGVLTALPVLASVLAVFTHRRQGPAAVAALLRGMLAGMAGFALFCTVVALLVDRAGIPAAFSLAVVAALAAQAVAVAAGARPAPVSVPPRA